MTNAKFHEFSGFLTTATRGFSRLTKPASEPIHNAPAIVWNAVSSYLNALFFHHKEYRYLQAKENQLLLIVKKRCSSVVSPHVTLQGCQTVGRTCYNACRRHPLLNVCQAKLCVRIKFFTVRRRELTLVPNPYVHSKEKDPSCFHIGYVTALMFCAFLLRDFKQFSIRDSTQRTCLRTIWQLAVGRRFLLRLWTLNALVHRQGRNQGEAFWPSAPRNF